MEALPGLEADGAYLGFPRRVLLYHGRKQLSSRSGLHAGDIGFGIGGFGEALKHQVYGLVCGPVESGSVGVGNDYLLLPRIIRVKEPVRSIRALSYTPHGERTMYAPSCHVPCVTWGV